MQAVKAVLSTGELEFAGQLLQLASPLPALNVPATHWVHDPPSGPEKPGLQVQSVAFLLAPGESELEEHGTQEELP